MFKLSFLALFENTFSIHLHLQHLTLTRNQLDGWRQASETAGLVNRARNPIILSASSSPVNGLLHSFQLLDSELFLYRKRAEKTHWEKRGRATRSRSNGTKANSYLSETDKRQYSFLFLKPTLWSCGLYRTI